MIYNTKTIVFTDNKNTIPHEISQKNKPIEANVTRVWYEIKHINGKKKNKTDLLSRTLLYTINIEKYLVQEKILFELPKEFNQAEMEKKFTYDTGKCNLCLERTALTIS